ncbi:MAG: hypothetical protein RQ899_02050 [Pseudomonadales bacterium]|nr:hypothetical protein [Pseudomonadales bacterium]
MKAPGNRENNLVISSGHGFTDLQTFQFHPECFYKPYLAKSARPLDERKTGPLAQNNNLNAIRNDWGISVFRRIESSGQLTMSTRTFEEVMESIESGAAVVKLYSTTLADVLDDSTVEVSDQCTIMRPGPRALLGTNSVLYTNCDQVPGNSGGPLVLEFKDGTVEVVGIIVGTVQANSTANTILASQSEATKIADVHSVDIEPDTETMINIAIPLIPQMQPLSMSEAFFRQQTQRTQP